MKKFLLLTASLFLSAVLLACSPRSNKETQRITEADVVGNYVSYSLLDPLSIYTDLLLCEDGKPPVSRETITLELADSDLTFRDNMFKGICELSDDNSLIFKRREVIATGLMQTLAETTLKQSPVVFSTVHNEYLVMDSSLTLLQVVGELPAGNNTDCVIFLDHITFKNYHITFKKDGSCQMDSIDSTFATYHYEGTYTFDGGIILLTFTGGEAHGDTLTGTSQMALYIDSGEVYSQIYKKTDS